MIYVLLALAAASTLCAASAVRSALSARRSIRRIQDLNNPRSR